MAYGILRDHKLGKQNTEIIENTTDNSSAPSNHSYSYDKLNENTDITIIKSLTEETHYRTICCLEDKTSDIIKNKSASNPYSNDMLV